MLIISLHVIGHRAGIITAMPIVCSKQGPEVHSAMDSIDLLRVCNIRYSAQEFKEHLLQELQGIHTNWNTKS